jgi:hypothetical protein
MLLPEIFLEIIRKVDHIEFTPASQIARATTLAALSRVCKDFHTFTEPYLYSRFDQISENGEELPLLLRTLLEKPHLGHLVKSYVGTCFKATNIEMASYREFSILGSHRDSFPLLIPQLICAGIWSFAMPTEWWQDFNGGPEDFDVWTRQMKNGNWDALTALLLCFLPNIEEFNLFEYASVNGYPFIEAVFKRATWLQNQSLPINIESPGYQDLYAYGEEHPEFQKAMRLWKSAPKREDLNFGMTKLRRVNISCNHAEAYPFVGLLVHHAFPFLALKSVKKFSGHMMMEGDEHIPVHDFQTTDLTIHHTAFFEGMSEPFLASFKSLKRLVSNMDYNFAVAEEHWNLYELVPSHVSQAIAHLSDSLEELSLTQEKGTDVIGEDPDVFLPLESLTSFGKLRKLEASAEILLGRRPRRPSLPASLRSPDDVVVTYQSQRIQHFISMFPESLKYLTITHCDPAILGVIMPFLSSRVGSPQKLVEINLEFRPHLPVEPSVREWSICQELALKCGIRIKKSPTDTIRSCSSCDYSRELNHGHETRRRGIPQEWGGRRPV